MNSKKVGIVSVIVAIVLAGIWFFGHTDDPKSSSASANKSSRVANRKTGTRGTISSPRKSSWTKKDPSKKRSLRVEDEFDSSGHPYSAKDKQLAKSLQDALDADGDGEDRIARKNLLAWAAKAAASANPDVRQRAVDAYSWIGKDALAELTPLMADPDADVAESAIGAVEGALTEIDDSAMQFATSAAYLTTFSENTDAMVMLAGVMEGAALDIIDPDDEEDPEQVEATRQNRMDVVDALATMIERGGKLAEQAQETYATITGESWINADEAVFWAEDPQSYEPPEMSY